MPHVIAVNVSERKGEVKHPIPEGRFEVDHGLVGDAHAANWHRQVSLLAEESIDKMRKLGIEGLDPGQFAENITTEGLELFTLPVGTRLRIGPTLMEVTQIGKHCHQHCAIFKKVGQCIMPTEGIFCKVLEPGVVRAGDPIEVLSPGETEVQDA